MQLLFSEGMSNHVSSKGEWNKNHYPIASTKVYSILDLLKNSVPVMMILNKAPVVSMRMIRHAIALAHLILMTR